jgi:hypothetical protein
MTPQTIETELAYELLCLAADRIESHINSEDLDAAIVASLVTAIEIATARKLKPIHELFKEKT